MRASLSESLMVLTTLGEWLIGSPRSRMAAIRDAAIRRAPRWRSSAMVSLGMAWHSTSFVFYSSIGADHAKRSESPAAEVRGVVELSHTVVNGRTLVNLVAFAPAGALGIDFFAGSSAPTLGVGLVTYGCSQSLSTSPARPSGLGVIIGRATIDMWSRQKFRLLSRSSEKFVVAAREKRPSETEGMRMKGKRIYGHCISKY